MSFYSDMAAVARDVLSEFGQTGSVTRTTVTGGGPADATGGTFSATAYPARLAVFPIGQDRIDGTNIKAGDWQVICEALTIEVTADDTVQASYGGRTLNLSILAAGAIAPAGVTVAYDMVCRGA